MDLIRVVILATFWISFLVDIVDCIEACGTLKGLTFYCINGYHCCDPPSQTCCQEDHICSVGAVCIHKAAIIVPCLIVFGLFVFCVVCICFKKKKSYPGAIMQSSGQHRYTKSYVQKTPNHGRLPWVKSVD